MPDRDSSQVAPPFTERAMPPPSEPAIMATASEVNPWMAEAIIPVFFHVQVVPRSVETYRPPRVPQNATAPFPRTAVTSVIVRPALDLAQWAPSSVETKTPPIVPANMVPPRDA